MRLGQAIGGRVSKQKCHFRFSYLAIVEGLKELDDLEQSEGPFNESLSDVSSDNDSDLDENSKLSKSLEDIQNALKKRANLTANSPPLTDPRTAR